MKNAKMQQKLLTISIASYNIEKFIEETISSLFIDDEYMKKMEIFIVNDGSTDRTSELAHRFAEQHPDSIVVIDKENGGYGSTINASLPLSTGKYYKLLDGDDWYDTKELPGFLDYLEKCQADIVVSPFFEVRGTDALIDCHREISSDAEAIEGLTLQSNAFAMHEITIKTDILQAYNKPIAEHCFYTDWEYVFYCFAASETMARYGKPIYRYRLGVEGQSISLQGRRKHYKDLPIVSKRIIKEYTARKTATTGSKKDIMDSCIQYAIYCTFFAFMVLEEPKRHKKELVEFDREIKSKYHDAYMIGYRSKLVKATRLLHFSFYTFLCGLVMHKYEKEAGI